MRNDPKKPIAMALFEFDAEVVARGSYNKYMAPFGITPEDEIVYTAVVKFDERIPIYLHHINKADSMKQYFLIMTYQPKVEVLCIIPAGDAVLLENILERIAEKIKERLNDK